MEYEHHDLDERWRHDVAEIGEEELRELAEWRGWGLDYCRSLRNEAAIGLHSYRGKLCWAFPVYDEDRRLVSIHCRLDPEGPLDKPQWRYDPPGAGVHPVIRGNFNTATYCFVLESTWDVYSLEQILPPQVADGSLILGTCGAANADKTLVGLVLPSGCRILAIPHNDAAGQSWLKSLGIYFRKVGISVLRVPKPFKDLNDWHRAGGTSEKLGALLVDSQPFDPEQAETRVFPREKILVLPPGPPPMIIPGILYQGGKLLISAPSKARKSWLIFELAFCVANGLSWWGRPLPIGRVLLLNLELMRWEVRSRFEAIRQSYGQGDFNNIEVITLRGKQFQYTELALISKDCAKENFTLAAIDPVYKALVGLKENDPGDITRFLAAVEAFADEMNASAALSHHFAKGNLAAREAIDRASGTGVWARDPDGLIALTPNAKSPLHYTVEVDLRSFAQVPKSVIRWEHPRFYPDDGADPDDLKRPKPGPKQKLDNDDLVCLLSTVESVSFSELQERCLRIHKVSEKTFERRLAQAIQAKALFKSPIDGTYGRPPNR